MGEKRYYWMKFQRDFFKSLRIKKLRRLAGGDTFTIIYLKLQLLSIVSDGYLTFKHVLDSFEEEMAEEIDEDVENVQVTINYLLACDLMRQDGDTYFLPYASENIGSEGASAERVRNFRERQKALHCNTDVTEVKRLCNVERDIEIDKEKDKRVKKFTPPSFDEVKAYCLERGNKVDAKSFFDYYEAGGWKDSKGNPVKNWKQKCITWENHKEKKENKFNQMIHSDYDFEAIEKEILK